VKLARTAHQAVVPGFRFAGVRAGLKRTGPDVALIASDGPAVAVGLLTTNRAAAAPVRLTRARLRRGHAAAVLINAGNANACTGRRGVETAEASVRRVAERLGVDETEVLVCSTGRIGVPLPRARLLRGIERAVRALRPEGFADAARAICTTDAFPKTAVQQLTLGRRPVTIAAMAKGAGMICPELATLIVVVCTDAALARDAARQALQRAADATFNAISVDGDTSTNDSLLLLANGAAGNRLVERGSREAWRFEQALRGVLGELARLCVLDGEGATRCVEVIVRGATTDAAARQVARAIGTSTLCKCAFAGGDPNWGRFVSAAGTAGVPLDPDRIDVSIDGVRVARRGAPVAGALARAARRMRAREFRVELDLHLGRGQGRMLASDLTVAYVRFNAAYTT
jgi:glutamate N-acetyltransferase/amino-acid N-acetyltransferase